MIRFLCLLLMFSLLPSIGFANNKEKIDVSEWSELPIAHEGRIKPIDSFARIILKKISTRESIDNLSASEWLAEVVFDPANAIERDIFKITQPKILGLKKRKNKLYSYIEIAAAIDKNNKTISQLIDAKEEKWTPDQRELMRVFQNYILMTQTLRSLTAILPLPFAIPPQLHNDKTKITDYLELKKLEEKLTLKAKNTLKKKGANLENYTDDELKIADLSFQLRTIEEGGKNNVLFKIYPENQNNKHANWLTPWEIIFDGEGSPKSVTFLGQWQEMAIAYLQQNNTSFKKAIKENKQPTIGVYPTLKIEKIFNRIPLKNISLTLYFAVFFLIIIAFLRDINISKYTAALTALFGVAVLSHLLHITLRIFILDRPPVGTLYESVLFVSLICAVLMLLISILQKDDKKITSLFIGALSAGLLLFISYGLVDENKMTTLTAVLNTNFWLTTHVLCITIGYGFCLMAGVMAHIYLFQSSKNKNDKKALQSYFKTLLTLSIFSLLFTAVGTILGGIWADQSWGRFWGWDPKENGALLIVLWLVWLIHSRISGHFNNFHFVIGMAFINIIVVLSWFGVNLLNIGLHSYGFIEGIAISIASFCFFEVILISWLGIKAKGMINEN